MKKATIIANPNIALVKYWGKRDERLILPQNSSVSITLTNFFSKTTVEFSKRLKKDSFSLNGDNHYGGSLEYRKVKKVLDLVRKKIKRKDCARVCSINNFPTAAGLASSAAGLAALSVAASKAADLSLTLKEISIIARQGSGSAARSVFGGFVEWKKGKKKDGSDSFATQVASDDFWPDFRLIVVIPSFLKKEIPSTLGMKQSVKTSPNQKNRILDDEKSVREIKKAILKKNFKRVGEIAEKSSFLMHSTMMTTRPPIIYFLPETISIIKEVLRLRLEKEVPAYLTIDAGPQVKILCQKKDVSRIRNSLNKIKGVKSIHVCLAGEGPKEISSHLF